MKEAAVRLESIATSLVVEAAVAAAPPAEHGMMIGIGEAAETMTGGKTASALVKPTSLIESGTETETGMLTEGEATAPSP